MKKEKDRVEKQAYEKPVLVKRGNLKDITADRLLGSLKQS